MSKKDNDVNTQQLKAEADNALRSNEHLKAVELYKRILVRDRKDTDALFGLARISKAHDQIAQALQYGRACVQYKPRVPMYHLFLAEVLLPIGKTEEAIQRLNICLEFDPTNITAKVRKASAHERLTEYDDARKLVAELMLEGIRTPELDGTRATIALHDKNYEEAVDLCRPYIHNEAIAKHLRTEMAFTAGRAYDKLDDADNAMRALKVANALNSGDFDRKIFQQQVDELLAFCTKERMAQMPRAKNDSVLPVFVAAMPRSGTTLLDQILDSHPKAFGAGEITDIDFIRFDMPKSSRSGKAYPEALMEMNPRILGKIGEPYLQRLLAMSGGGATAVINKNLENFKVLPLISQLFPKAPIIHAKRNGIDCALSIYMNSFNTQTHPWTADLDDIGFVYRQHERVMNHWMEVLEHPILLSNYEDLVNEPEERTRAIVEFCHLEWDDACLSFHEKKRSVMTPSYHQVAQPIYKSSIGQHKRYEKFFGPLIEELEKPI
jgi:tetratricopeptide (TPR) repeat protein